MRHLKIGHADVAYALYAIGDPAVTGYTEGRDRELVITVPSTGSAMVFAAALAARATTEGETTGTLLDDLPDVAEIMTRASDHWDKGVLRLTFPGVHLAGPQHISVNQLCKGYLPGWAAGVRWTYPHSVSRTECAPCMYFPAWMASAETSWDEPNGEVMTALTCASCGREVRCG
jgi:hypothetical protein